MSNLLSKGQAMFARLLQRGAAPATTGGPVPITYHPVANPTEAIDLTGKAWVGRTVFSRVNQEGGAAVVFGDRDYLIPVAAVTALLNLPALWRGVAETLAASKARRDAAA